MPEILETIHPTGPGHFGVGERGIIALLNPQRLRRVLTRMLDENEFLSDYGIRSLSKYHLEHPHIFSVDGDENRVDYMPAESAMGLFGGNSNWRGPVWVPVNALILRALLSFYEYYGDNFKIECPTGSGRLMNLFEVAKEIVGRLAKNFPTRWRWAPDLCMALRKSSSPIRTGARTYCSTNISTATTARGKVRAIRRGGLAWWAL